MQPEDFRLDYAETFKDDQVADAYRYRSLYPDEVFDILTGLITDEPHAVLDVGSGSGDIARRLVESVERVDAVDFSQKMIERGKQLPHGKHPHLHWIYGKVEEVPLSPPYALITAGMSIRWLTWEVAFPRFRNMLTPHGYLALIHRRRLMPWKDELRKIGAQFAMHRRHRRRRVVEELEARGFFHKQGQKETTPIPFVQSIDDFIESLHSGGAFSRQLMGLQKAAEFDQQVKSMLLQYHKDGLLPLQVGGSVIWGKL